MPVGVVTRKVPLECLEACLHKMSTHLSDACKSNATDQVKSSPEKGSLALHGKEYLEGVAT